MAKQILKGVDCDYIAEINTPNGMYEPYCKKRIYDICCSECSFNRLSKSNEKYKYFINKFNKTE